MTQFSTIARLYARARGISLRQGAALKKIGDIVIEDNGKFGEMSANKIRNRHVAEVAQRLYPCAAASTRNREVIVPVNAALRWAAREELISTAPIIERFREDRVLPRRPAPGALEALIAGTEGAQKAFLILLRSQGWRLSEALGLKWADVDFESKSLTIWVGKAKCEKTVPMHDAVMIALGEAMGRNQKYVFPWRSPSQIYNWLRPLCEKHGLNFTPHQARHEFASKLNEVAGATPSDLVKLGTWTTTSSIQRYINPTDSHVRSLLSML